MSALPAYSAFALTIASEVPLPELPRAAGEPDVEVHLDSAGAASTDSDELQVVIDGASTHGWMPTVGAFRVSSGRTISVAPLPNVDERALRMAIVGPLLGVILAQRGKFVLHASTVAINGRGVAFCGASGAGKSTLSAALLRAGHTLIADDMTVIDIHGAIPWVQPGFPRIKLWPDATSALAYDTETLPLIHPDREKRSVPATTDFHARAVPLARCYLLRDAAAHAIAALSASEAIVSLVKCTYQSAWLHQGRTAGGNLISCGNLVRSGVVRELQRRRCFDELPALLRLIENDLAADSLRQQALTQ